MKQMPTDVPDRQRMVRRIAFFDKHYSLNADRLVDDSGRTPAQVVDDLIRRYLNVPLPIGVSSEDAWCSFRELRGAGPLSVNFANNTHKTIAVTFGGDLLALDRGATKMAGLLEPGQGYDR